MAISCFCFLGGEEQLEQLIETHVFLGLAELGARGEVMLTWFLLRPSINSRKKKKVDRISNWAPVGLYHARSGNGSLTL